MDIYNIKKLLWTSQTGSLKLEWIVDCIKHLQMQHICTCIADFFQSLVYTHFSEICPQGCEHEMKWSAISDGIILQTS